MINKLMSVLKNSKNAPTLLVATAAFIIGTAGMSVSVSKALHLFVPNNEIKSNPKEVTSVVTPEASTPSLSLTTAKNSVRVKKIHSLSLNSFRTLYVYGPVGGNTETLVSSIIRLSNESNEPIVIIINSPGGSVFSGERVISAMEASKAPVYTVCDGMCASMAAIIHQYGTKRLATDRSVLMFHDASGMVGGRVNEMLSLLSLIKRKLEKTNAYIANRSKISYEELMSLSANNFWIDAEDALDKGLVDDLVSFENPLESDSQ